MTPADAPAAAHPEGRDPQNVRHNFSMLVGDVACFYIGISFLDSSTALPALIGRLGGGPELIGAVGALRQGLYYLPPLLAAHWLHGRARHKPFLLAVTFAGRIGYFFAALAVLLFGRSQPSVALAALIAAYAISWLGDGAGGVPWTAMVGRMIPDRMRGRLFASTQFVGGVCRVGVGALVALLLGGRAVGFPAADALIVLGCAVGMAVSWAFLALLREPPMASAGGHEEGGDGREDEPRAPLRAYLRALPSRFRERPDLARLAAAQVLAAASGATSPFLLRYASSATPGGLSADMAGRFLIAQTLGLLAFAPLWGYLTDRHGPRVTLAAVFAASLLWPAVAALGGLAGGSLPLFYLAYFLLGGVLDTWAPVTTYMLEAVRSREQATWTGLLNTASAPALLLPFTAGLLVGRLGAGVALVFAALLLAAGLAAALTLPDTRRKA